MEAGPGIIVSLPNFRDYPCFSDNNFDMVSKGQTGLEGNGNSGEPSSLLSRSPLTLFLFFGGGGEGKQVINLMDTSTFPIVLEN
jgi:hypothetical protein